MILHEDPHDAEPHASMSSEVSDTPLYQIFTWEQDYVLNQYKHLRGLES